MGWWPPGGDWSVMSWSPSVREGENVYLQSTLNISEVLVDFLGAELKCVVINPLGKDTGVLRLQPGNHHAPAHAHTHTNKP